MLNMYVDILQWCFLNLGLVKRYEMTSLLPGGEIYSFNMVNKTLFWSVLRRENIHIV